MNWKNYFQTNDLYPGSKIKPVLIDNLLKNESSQFFSVVSVTTPDFTFRPIKIEPYLDSENILYAL